MRFDPQSNFVPSDDQPIVRSRRGTSRLGSLIGQGLAAVVILGFGGATLAAVMFFLEPDSAPGWIILPGLETEPTSAPRIVTGPGPAAPPRDAEAEPPADRLEAPELPVAPPPPPPETAADTARIERARAAYREGRAYAAVGRLDDAVPALLEAIELEPDHAAAHYALGLVHVRRRDAASARAVARVLHELDPSLANLIENLLEDPPPLARGPR